MWSDKDQCRATMGLYHTYIDNNILLCSFIMLSTQRYFNIKMNVLFFSWIYALYAQGHNGVCVRVSVLNVIASKLSKFCVLFVHLYMRSWCDCNASIWNCLPFCWAHITRSFGKFFDFTWSEIVQKTFTMLCSR